MAFLPRGLEILLAVSTRLLLRPLSFWAFIAPETIHIHPMLTDHLMAFIEELIMKYIKTYLFLDILPKIILDLEKIFSLAFIKCISINISLPGPLNVNNTSSK